MATKCTRCSTVASLLPALARAQADAVEEHPESAVEVVFRRGSLADVGERRYMRGVGSGERPDAHGGRGPVVRGRAVDIISVLAGRPRMIERLDGDGVDELASRVAVMTSGSRKQARRGRRSDLS